MFYAWKMGFKTLPHSNRATAVIRQYPRPLIVYLVPITHLTAIMSCIRSYSKLVAVAAYP